MTDHEARGILSYLRGRRQDMVDLLRRLALAESPSDNPAAVAPVLALLTFELEQAGMSVRQFPGRVSAGTRFARPRERDKKAPLQLLVGHCDTVWPVGTVRQMPVRVEGETLRGPGVLDMKGGLVQMLYALRAVKDLGLRPPADGVVMINSDEEIGSPDSTPLIRRLARRAVRAFILEPAFGRAGKLKTARKASGVVKMLRLLSPPRVRTDGLTPACAALAELVLRLFRNRTVLPRIAEAVHNLPLFTGLSAEQVARLAGACGVAAFEPGEPVFREGEAGDRMQVVLRGEVAITVAGSAAAVGVVRGGECLGEMSLLTAAAHSATATARTHVETAVLGRQDLAELIRPRPDIGLLIYRNLAVGMGEKLKRLNVSLADR
jgi:acetylornithine deacetylase/succinyl-diaminopimelate desuccinylase-like protein